MRACVVAFLLCVALVSAQYNTLTKTCTNTNTAGGCQNCNAPISWLFWDPASGKYVNRVTGQYQDSTTVVCMLSYL